MVAFKPTFEVGGCSVSAGLGIQGLGYGRRSQRFIAGVMVRAMLKLKGSFWRYGSGWRLVPTHGPGRGAPGVLHHHVGPGASMTMWYPREPDRASG